MIFSTHSTHHRIEEYSENDQFVFDFGNSGAIEFIRPVMNQGLQELNDFENANDKKKRIGYVHVVVSKEKIKENAWLFIYSVAVITGILVAIRGGVDAGAGEEDSGAYFENFASGT